MSVKVGIVGATGYTGGELLRILFHHESARVTYVASRSAAGRPVEAVHPALGGCYDLRFEPVDTEAMAKRCDVVFLAVPHGASKPLAARFVAAGVPVIDIGSDFRLHDADAYGEWYGDEHTHPDLLAQAVYGLPELNRAAIAETKLVANPGCYPTAVILGAAPFVHVGVVDAADVVVTAVTGVSGAGGTPGDAFHFPHQTENVQPYGVPGHRHTAEMEQGLSALAAARGEGPVGVTFVPQLVPMSRGILATIHMRLAETMTTEDVLHVMRGFYRAERFVRVLGLDLLPTTKMATGTNMCLVTARVDERTGRVIVFSAIDNLVKGAAGQAVQNMNILFGLDEATGLKTPALYP